MIDTPCLIMLGLAGICWLVWFVLLPHKPKQEPTGQSNKDWHLPGGAIAQEFHARDGKWKQDYEQPVK